MTPTADPLFLVRGYCSRKRDGAPELTRVDFARARVACDRVRVSAARDERRRGAERTLRVVAPTEVKRLLLSHLFE